MHQDIRKHLIIHTLSGNSTKFELLQNISGKGIKKLMNSKTQECSSLEIDDLLLISGETMLDYLCGTNFLDSDSKGCSHSIARIFMEGHDRLKNAHIFDVFPVLKHFKIFFPSIRELCKSHDDIM